MKIASILSFAAVHLAATLSMAYSNGLKPYDIDPDNLVCGVSAQLIVNSEIPDLHVINTAPPQPIDGEFTPPFEWKVSAMNSTGTEQKTLIMSLEPSVQDTCRLVSFEIY